MSLNLIEAIAATRKRANRSIMLTHSNAGYAASRLENG